MEVHNFKVSEPFVAHDRFVVQYDADVTDKSSKQRRQMSEVGVYTVKDGKIVREEFLPRVGLRRTHCESRESKAFDQRLARVLLDQRLEARIFAQRIPGRIELEHWNRDRRLGR